MKLKQKPRYTTPRTYVYDMCQDGYCNTINIPISSGSDGDDSRDVKGYDMEFDEPTTIMPTPSNVWDKAW